MGGEESGENPNYWSWRHREGGDVLEYLSVGAVSRTGGTASFVDPRVDPGTRRRPRDGLVFEAKAFTISEIVENFATENG